MASQTKRNKGPRLVCFCNAIPQSAVEEAIRQGANSLGKIFDTTTAGVGACGGSCQPTLKKMLESYQQSGKFPEHPGPTTRRSKTRRSGQ